MLTPRFTRIIGHTPCMGFSLVELMIALTVGLVVLGGVIGLYTNTIKSGSDTFKATRLNQELRAIMDVMVRDIQRAGYWSGAANIGTLAVNSVGNPFTTGINDLTINVAGNCITYSYDLDGNGTVDNDERFAFFLQDGAVGMRKKGDSAATNSCSPTQWERINDENVTNITALSFTLTTSCINVTDKPASNCLFGGTGYVAPTASDILVTVRRVNIRLAGELRGDSTVTRDITESVRVRNDLIRSYTPPPPP